MKRRSLISLLSATPVIGLAGYGVFRFAGNETSSPEGEPLILSAANNKAGQHFVAVLNGQTGKLKFIIPIADRGHQVMVSPDHRNAVAFARSPGNLAQVVDLRLGEISLTIKAGSGHHFQGHGVYSADGQLLFTAENDFNRGRGVISVRDTQQFKIQAQWSSGGIGPHQLAWTRSGKTLIVANGGLLTHPERGSEILNRDSMRPNLTFMNPDSGDVLNQFELADHQLSIRHFDVGANDEILVGLQYQGDPSALVPLVALHTRENSLRPLPTPELVQLSVHQYAASVCIDAATGNAVVTCPKGNLVTFWNVNQEQFVGDTQFDDCAGVCVDAKTQEFVLSNSFGEVRRLRTQDFTELASESVRVAQLQWDNHLVPA